MATREGHDLVEVSPNTDPPVCKIMDYGKYKYQASKKQQEGRKKAKTMLSFSGASNNDATPLAKNPPTNPIKSQGTRARTI